MLLHRTLPRDLRRVGRLGCAPRAARPHVEGSWSIAAQPGLVGSGNSVAPQLSSPACSPAEEEWPRSSAAAGHNGGFGTLGVELGCPLHSKGAEWQGRRGSLWCGLQPSTWSVSFLRATPMPPLCHPAISHSLSHALSHAIPPLRRPRWGCVLEAEASPHGVDYDECCLLLTAATRTTRLPARSRAPARAEGRCSACTLGTLGAAQGCSLASVLTRA